MPERPALDHLRDALKDLAAWLDASRVPAMLIGGVAISLRGRARFTRDVDVTVLLDEPQWPSFLAAGKPFGFVPRRADAIAFAARSRVLLVRHDASGIDVDVVIGGLSFERESVARAEKLDVAGARLPVATPEDLLIMKALARRPRDRADIEAILDTHPRLDVKRIRRVVGDFANALDMPDLAGELDRYLSGRHKRKR
jgi:hypothetical protein